jgi:PAS domain S-box-containing protein
MFRNRPQLGFPRKVVAYYLLFCMATICWLTVGVVATSHTVLSSHTINACLTRLGRTAAAIEIEYLRHGSDKLAAILAQAKLEARLQYGSVVAPDGTILAHTNPNRIGTQADKPVGSLLRWGNVTGVRFVDQHDRTLRQYQVPLGTQDAPLGSLQIAVTEPSLWGTVAETAHIAPFAILVPLALVAVGALVISRLLKCFAGIEAQLHSIATQPAGAELVLKSLPARDMATLGWNRVVDLMESLPYDSAGEGLETRVSKAVANRKQDDMHEILQNLPEGVAVTDMEGRITFANRAIAVLLGSEQADEELTGQAMEVRLLEGMPAPTDCPLFDPQFVNRQAISEFQRTLDQSNRVLRVARQPIRSEQFKGQVWSLRDVTQQKLAEKMRDQFIDTATHEMRTPLSNIKAYAETLVTCDSIEIEEQKEFCNIINSETTRLARFVDDLLSISSMEVGSLSVELQPVEMDRLFTEIEAKVLPLMQQKEIQFDTRLPQKMPKLQLDKEKMVAVLVNLLGNAAKYTPEGGNVSLKVKISETQLQMAIEDAGVGISAEELPKVFDKFFRSNDTRVQAESGTGLGLTLAREIVHIHGGKLTVESQLDKGSTFLVTIPLQ